MIHPPVIDTPAVVATAAVAAAPVDIEELEAQFAKRLRDLREARDNKKKYQIKALIAQAIYKIKSKIKYLIKKYN